LSLAIPNVDATRPVDGSLTDTAATPVDSLDLQPINIDAMSLMDDLLTNTADIPIGPPSLQPTDASEDATDMDYSLGRGIPHANSETLSNSSDISTETQVTHNIDTLPAVDAIVLDAKVSATATPQVITGVATELVAKITALARPPPTITLMVTSHSLPPPASPNNIDTKNIPSFLHSHGKGK
jgi:hypothetical protein